MSLSFQDPTRLLTTPALKEKYQTLYKEGLEQQLIAMSLLTDLGFTVTPSTQEEDWVYDIDCYVNGVPTSIKAEHAGEGYGNIYFEIVTQRWMPHEWTSLWKTEAARELKGCYQYSDGFWFPGWRFFSRAEQYVIFQGSRLLQVATQDLKRHVEAKGWQKVKGLTYKNRLVQGGRDTICGYLDNDLRFINPLN